MDEFLQSIAKGIKERLGSAFLFNFILSWIVFNWEFVYITLFVDENNLVPFNKFDTLYDTVFVVWPAIATAIILSISSPFINSIIQLVKHVILKLRDWAENKIDGKVVYTDKQYADLKMVNQRLNDKFNKAIKDSENDKQSITNLEQSNKLLDEQTIILEEKLKEKLKEYDELGLTFKSAKETILGLNERNEIKEIEYKNLIIENEELRNFGFYLNADAIVTYKLKHLLKDDEWPLQIIERRELYNTIAEVFIDLTKKRFTWGVNEYKIIKYFNTKDVICFLASFENGPLGLYSIAHLDSLYDLIQIHNFEVNRSESYIMTR